MLPEESFNFNRFRTSSNFDHPEVRWPHLLQQDAVSALEAGRHLLAVCPICKHPWYKAGRQEYPRLTPVQLAFLGATLQVDSRGPLPASQGDLHDLQCLSPGRHVLRRDLSARRRVSLPVGERLASSHPAAGDGLCSGGTHPGCARADDIPSGSPNLWARCVPCLTWLETCPFPETIQTLSDEQSQHLARSFPPGNTIDESLRCWRGYAWETNCPLLGGHALVSLAVTTRPDALPPFASLRMGWQVLARAMRVVL